MTRFLFYPSVLSPGDWVAKLAAASAGAAPVKLDISQQNPVGLMNPDPVAAVNTPLTPVAPSTPAGKYSLQAILAALRKGAKHVQNNPAPYAAGGAAATGLYLLGKGRRGQSGEARGGIGLGKLLAAGALGAGGYGIYRDYQKQLPRLKALAESGKQISYINDANDRLWNWVQSYRKQSSESPVSLALLQVLRSKRAAETDEQDSQARQRTVELLPMRGASKAIQDALPGLWGGVRAGRATQLAEALGIKPGLRTRYPITTATGEQLAGSLAGGLAGGLIGGVGSHLVGVPRELSGGQIGAGVAVGGLLGILAGHVHNTVKRRQQMKTIQQKLYNHLRQHGPHSLRPQTKDWGLTSSVLLPLSGAHRAGQADTHEALRTGEPYGGRKVRNATYALAPVAAVASNVAVPGSGQAVMPLVGLLQNLRARAKMRRSLPTEADELRSES